MVQKFYIRQNNIILGPFERQILINMLNTGKLTLQDDVSTDKTNWQSPEIALQLLVPDSEDLPDNAEAPIPAAPAAPEKPTPKAAAEPESATVIDLDSCIDLDAEDFSKSPKFGDILLTVIASLGNGGGYLHRLNQYNAGTMLAAGVAAAVLSLIFSAAGALLFGSCYNVSTAAFCVRCMIAAVLSGVIFWGGSALVRAIAALPRDHKAAEADFLAGMQAMMSMSIVGIILNGSLFVFNRVLFNMRAEVITAVLLAALLPLIFFAVNAILSLRMNFMGSSRLSPGMASLWAIVTFYATAVLNILLLYAVYRFD